MRRHRWVGIILLLDILFFVVLTWFLRAANLSQICLLVFVPIFAFQLGFYKKELAAIREYLCDPQRLPASHIQLMRLFFVLIFFILLSGQLSIIHLPDIWTPRLWIILSIVFLFFFWLIKDNTEGKTAEASLLFSINVERVLFVLILCVAAFLRFRSLFEQNIGVDAYHHLNSAHELLQLIIPSYLRGITYSFLVALTLLIFQGSTTAVIGLSILINLGSLCVSYIVIRKLLGSPVALITLLFLALSSWSIGGSYMIRFYDMFQLLFIVIVYLLSHIFVERQPPVSSQQTVPRPRIRLYMLLIVTLLLAFNHQKEILTLFLPVYLFTAVLFLFDAGTRVSQKERILTTSLLRSTPVILLTLMTVGAILTFFQFSQYFEPFIRLTEFRVFTSSTPNYYTLFLKQSPALFLTFFAAVGIGCISFIGSAIRRPATLIQVIFYGVLIQFLYLFAWRIYAPRYVYYLLPIFYAIFSLGIYVSWTYILMPLLLSIRRISREQVRAIASVGLLAIPLLFISMQPTTAVSSWPTTGLNPLLEINYPYKELIPTIPIKENDLLFESQPGVWKTWQSTSSNIFLLYTINLNSGNVFPPEELSSLFLQALKKSSHGYYLTDTYRHRQWACEKNAQLPCFIRDFVNTAFTTTSSLQKDNLIVYTWSILRPTSIQEKPDGVSLLPSHTFLNKVGIRYLDEGDIVKEEDGIHVTLHVASLEKNTGGVYLVIKPTFVRSPDVVSSSAKHLLYIPPLKANDDLSYTLILPSADQKMESIDSLWLDLSLVDIEEQKIYYLTKKGLLPI